MMPLAGPQRGSPACVRECRRHADTVGLAGHTLVRSPSGGSISNISITRGQLVSAATATSHLAIGVGDRRYQRRRRTWSR